MFKHAQKLKKRWDEDLKPLLATEVSFDHVMKTLAKEFKLKDEKEKLKKKEEARLPQTLENFIQHSKSKKVENKKNQAIIKNWSFSINCNP